MPFEKGISKVPGSGRQKGVTNKDNANIRAMILESLSMAGGVEYLYRQSQEQPVAYLGLIAKVIPKEVEATIKEEDRTITINIVDAKKPE